MAEVMTMSKKEQVKLSELIESHRPKNFKHKYILNDDNLRELESEGYDISKLDTIHNDELIQLALEAHYKEYERTVVGKAKEPSILEDGIIISKKMVTKSDKKLLSLGVGRFECNNVEYVSIRLRYERFDIIELFILN
jgi:hypothetical protein